MKKVLGKCVHRFIFYHLLRKDARTNQLIQFNIDSK